MTTWMNEMITALTKIAASITQVGRGERRTRLRSPISRRTTMEIVKLLKHADMTP